MYKFAAAKVMLKLDLPRCVLLLSRYCLAKHCMELPATSISYLRQAGPHQASPKHRGLTSVQPIERATNLPRPANSGLDSMGISILPFSRETVHAACACSLRHTATKSSLCHISPQQHRKNNLHTTRRFHWEFCDAEHSDKVSNE